MRKSGTRFLARFAIPLIIIVAYAACNDTQEPIGPEALAPALERNWTEAADGKALTDLTEAVAVSLEDRGLRMRILEDMRASPFREHKIGFRSYIAGESGGILKAKMRSSAGLTDAAIDELLDAAPPVEFYMPVPDHRMTWTGGPEVIVASQIEDDDVPVGFNISGDKVDLALEEPPSKPVLSLVPVETDFSSPPSRRDFRNTDRVGGDAIGVYSPLSVSLSSDCDPTAILPCDGGGSGGINWSELSPGLWIEEMYLADLGESWPKGEPEIEIHTAFQDPLESSGEIIRCVAESKSGDAQYVQNDNDGDDIALIGTQTQLDALPDEQGLMFIVYEDDDTTCVIKDETDALENTVGVVKAFKSGLDGLRSEESSFGKIVAVAESVIEIITFGSGTINTNDDLIGEIIENSCSKDGRSGNWEVRRDTGLKGCATLRAN